MEGCGALKAQKIREKKWKPRRKTATSKRNKAKDAAAARKTVEMERNGDKNAVRKNALGENVFGGQNGDSFLSPLRSEEGKKTVRRQKNGIRMEMGRKTTRRREKRRRTQGTHKIGLGRRRKKTQKSEGNKLGKSRVRLLRRKQTPWHSVAARALCTFLRLMRNN